MDKNKIIEMLAGVFYLATSEDNQPHVRPFDGAAIMDGKIYIGTNRSKKVYHQIEKNPKIEIFSMENGTIRFTAEAFSVKDEADNKKAYEAIGKTFSDGCAAIELKNLHGEIQGSMGEKIEFSF